MNVKTAKIIRIILLIVACIACFLGVSKSQEAARDPSKISVQITDKECYYNPDESPYINGCYHIDFTVNIENKTNVDWTYLEITTYVYDKDGDSLGTITSDFGSDFGGDSGFKVEAGDSITQTSSIEANQLDDFVATLYETDFSDLTFKSEVTRGTYSE